MRMRIKQLKELIANMPDDAYIVTPGEDHSYREASVEAGTALKAKDGSWSEDYGEESTPEAEYGKRLPVLIVS